MSERHLLRGSRHFPVPHLNRTWLAGSLCCLLIAALANPLLPGSNFPGWLSTRAAGLDVTASANLLLMASSVLYLGHFWGSSKKIGRLASGLALAGTLAILLAVAIHAFASFVLRRPGPAPLTAPGELVALISALTVAAYLAMERVYRTRSASAFVMPIVLAAVLYQFHLGGIEDAAQGQRTGMRGRDGDRVAAMHRLAMSSKGERPVAAR